MMRTTPISLWRLNDWQSDKEQLSSQAWHFLVQRKIPWWLSSSRASDLTVSPTTAILIFCISNIYIYIQYIHMYVYIYSCKKGRSMMTGNPFQACKVNCFHHNLYLQDDPIRASMSFASPTWRCCTFFTPVFKSAAMFVGYPILRCQQDAATEQTCNLQPFKFDLITCLSSVLACCFILEDNHFSKTC